MSYVTKNFDGEQILVLGDDPGDGRRPLLATCTGPDRHRNAALFAKAPQLVYGFRRLLSLAETLDIDLDDCDAHERLDEARALHAQLEGL